MVYIREAGYKDVNFILNSWQRSFKHSLKDCSESIYNAKHEKLIIKLLSKCQCLMAVNPEDLYQIYGWVCFDALKEIGIMHYMYVKHPYRKYGIGTQLFKMIEHDKKYPCMVSHTTRHYKHIKNKWNLTFNPYLLLEIDK